MSVTTSRSPSLAGIAGGYAPLDSALLVPASYLGHELDYVEFTGTVSITQTAEASANTIVTGSAVSYDGSTTVIVEFFAPYVDTGATSADEVLLWLYDGSSSIGYIGRTKTPAAAALRVPVHAMRRLTPSNASHTYSIRGTRAGTNNGTIGAGAGGTGAAMPGYIRITRADR